MYFNRSQCMHSAVGDQHYYYFFFLKGLPISTNSRKRSIPPCKYQACQTDMEVDTNPILQASPPPPRYRCKCIETHRMCSRVAAGALPMPCKCIATGSKCFQSGRTSCQHGPGQALCSGLPCLVQCRGGQCGGGSHGASWFSVTFSQTSRHWAR